MTKEKALNKIAMFLYPDITRGPANPKWLKAMIDLAEAFSFPQCEGCCGTGQNDYDCCEVCLGVGRVPGSLPK